MLGTTRATEMPMPWAKRLLQAAAEAAAGVPLHASAGRTAPVTEASPLRGNVSHSLESWSPRRKTSLQHAAPAACRCCHVTTHGAIAGRGASRTNRCVGEAVKGKAENRRIQFQSQLHGGGGKEAGRFPAANQMDGCVFVETRPQLAEEDDALRLRVGASRTLRTLLVLAKKTKHSRNSRSTDT